MWVEAASARWNAMSNCDGRVDVSQRVVLELLDGLVDPLDVLGRGALGGEPGGGDLEHAPHLVDLAVVHRAALDEVPHRLVDGLLVDRDDAHAAAALDLEHPFALSARTASRITVRETPNCSPSSRSVGSASPGLSWSEAITRGSRPSPCPTAAAPGRSR